MALSMVTDVEGVAYDPASGNVWVACEGTQTITEFDPANGAPLRRVILPSVLSTANIVSNYGFESLTISGDGLTMWTANEEALKIDGSRSSMSAGTTCRLVRFDRDTVHDDWHLTAMYAYTTDQWHHQYSYGGAGRRGISDLCALPDGTLLVMERELSTDEDGTGFWAGLGVDLYTRIYRVTREAMATATDISGNPGLKNNGGWTAVAKASHFRSDEGSGMGWSNCEGLCLGPRLASGSVVLLMVTDAGDGTTSKQVVPLVMSGLNVRTLAFNSPSSGEATVTGTNYRLLNGATVEVALRGEGIDPAAYTNEGAVCAVSAGWSLPNHSPASGQGFTANFTVSADDTFSWALTMRAAETGLLAHDTFEEYAAGAETGSMAGWSGDGSVEARVYPAPACGYPLGREAHTKVLAGAGDQLTRTYDLARRRLVRFEAMFEIRRMKNELAGMDDNAQVVCCAGADGCLRLGHRLADGTPVWTKLSDVAFANGDWVRIGVELDYGGDPAGHTYARVWINGYLCRTAAGLETPGGRAGGGVWHRALADRGVNGQGTVSSVDITGDTAVDDVVLASSDWSSEGIDGVTVGGVPANWFDEHGFAREPLSAAPGTLGSKYGYSLADVYTAGIRPEDGEPLKITGMSMGDGQLQLEFNAIKVAPDTVFGIYGAEDLGSGTAGFTELMTGASEFDEDRGEWRTTWTGELPAEGSRFNYQIRATRK